MCVVGQEEKRMKVQSVILLAASTTFDALLGPSFIEGRNISSEHPPDISLPEDDAVALQIIFSILHYRMEAIDDPLDPTIVLRVAIMADKYDLIQSLDFAIREWLRCDTVRDPKQLWQLAVASRWFSNKKGFEDSTRTLLLHYGGSYIGLCETDMMPPDMATRFPGKYCLISSSTRC